MKRNNSLFLSPIALLSLCSCSLNKVPENLFFDLESHDKDIIIYTQKQKEYFEDDNPNNIEKYTGTRQTDESKSISTTISWECVDEKGKSPSKYRFYLSEDLDFLNPLTYEIKTNSVTLNNLKIGLDYYYTVSAIYGKEEINSEINSFTTSSLGLRNLNIPSISNFRDIGGMATSNGKKIKQGLIYRSAEFNKSYTKNTLISKDDKKIILEQLKIKSEIDLRKIEETDDGIETGNIAISPIDKNINYFSCPMHFGGFNVLTLESNQESIKDFFNYLGDENNYPLVFHCAQGKDRTGCMAFVLETLLGVTEDMMARDYLFTNFSDINGVCKYNDIFGGGKSYMTFKNYENGETLQEKAYNYLAEISKIPTTTLDKIISIMSE